MKQGKILLGLFVIFALSLTPAALAEPSDAVLIGIEGTDSSPFSFLGEEGLPDGLDVRILSALMEEIGVPYAFCVLEEGTLADALIAGEIDIAVPLASNPESTEAPPLPLPYYRPDIRIVTAKENPAVTCSADLTAVQGVRVGVKEGSMGDIAISAQLEPSRYDSAESAIADLQSGQLDAVLLDGEEAQTYSVAEDLQVLSEPLAGAQRCFALRPGDAEALELFAQTLAQMQGSGRYEEILGMYFVLPQQAEEAVAPAMPLP